MWRGSIAGRVRGCLRTGGGEGWWQVWGSGAGSANAEFAVRAVLTRRMGLARKWGR